MKKKKEIITAANSKTMNGVENTNLFAAAGEINPVINFRDVANDLMGPGSSPDKTNDRHAKKKKNILSRNK